MVSIGTKTLAYKYFTLSSFGNATTEVNKIIGSFMKMWNESAMVIMGDMSKLYTDILAWENEENDV